MTARRLHEHVKRLSPARRAAVWCMVALLVLTWLAVCLVLASFWIQKAG